MVKIFLENVSKFEKYISEKNIKYHFKENNLGYHL